jgi:RNA-directed DNA polymerase
MEEGSLKQLLSGTPQGGVISPLLSNIYLDYLDTVWQERCGGLGRLVRYADDFVVLARYQGTRLTNWLENHLEGRFRLTINREKTSVVNLRTEGSSLDFLGFTFRYDRDLKGRGHRYLNVAPSRKALTRVRHNLRERISSHRCFVPLPKLIAELNRWLRSWANYFDHGYPRKAFRDVNHFVRERLTRHLQRRSQRPFRPPEGHTFYAQLHALGLKPL